jgi:uncharacterized protein (DUF433 family)
MKHGKAKWGFIVVGAVAALALGAIGVAGAASSDSTATPTPSSSALPGEGAGHDRDGDGQRGGHGGMLKEGGPGDLAEALADLSGKDEATIMQQRAAGTSFAEIAKSYGVSEADLIAAATKIETAELEAAVKTGQITEAQKTEYLAGLQERLTTAIASTDAMPVGGPGGMGGGHHGGPGGMGGGGDLAEALANLSGKDEATIMEQRAAGTSFAEIAKSYGVSEADLIAAATRIETAELEAAVKAGQITEAQKTEILSGLQAHLEQEIAETHAIGGPGDGDGPHGGFDGDDASGSDGADGAASASPSTQTSYQVY